MNILFMGTPDFAVPSLEGLLRAGHNIVGVVTQPDKPRGRKMVLTPPPVKALALAHGLDVYQPDTLKDGALLPLLERTRPDLIAVVAYGKLLPGYVLDFPARGCINVHGSLLPRWRGAAPIQWSVLAGDRYAGVTTMQMGPGLDTGDMLLQYRTEIGPRETAGELFDRLAGAGAQLLCDTIDRLDEIQPTPQDGSQATHASMLDKSMAEIDWSKPAGQIDCLVRGMNPWPVAWTRLDGQVMKIFAAEPVEDLSGQAGTVLRGKDELLVACGAGAVRVTELQMAGGKRMASRDYLRGHPVPPGTRLG